MTIVGVQETRNVVNIVLLFAVKTMKLVVITVKDVAKAMKNVVLLDA